MITAFNIAILAVTTFLTLSFFPHFKIFGAVPLLPLFFVIQLAYYRKGFEPVLLAALTGLFFDLFSPYPFGSYFLLFLVTAGVVRYFFGEGLRALSFWHYLVITAAALILYQGAQLIYLATQGTKLTTGVLLPSVAYLSVNLVFAMLLYAFGLWYFEYVLIIENHLKRR